MEVVTEEAVLTVHDVSKATGKIHKPSPVARVTRQGNTS